MTTTEPSDRDRAALEDALAETREELEHLRDLDRWKDAFLSAAAHDLRSPVAVIVGAAETLAERPELDRNLVETLARRILAQAQRLDRLLADLFDLDRFTRGAVVAERRLTNVTALAHEVVARTATDGHPLEVVPGDTVTAEVDAPRLEQILDNLLANAVAHTPPGTPIRVEITGDADHVTVIVEDEGRGVPDELRDDLFLPFTTAPAHEADRPGTGIGLSLVQLFTELHGGSARVEDREGGGARFVVELPGA